jgi:SAM-dependent methyltransferase
MFFNDDLNGNLNFDLVAERYTSARPSYPRDIYELIINLFGLGSLAKIKNSLEIGSGSGQATNNLREISECIDCIEPGKNFSAILRSRFSGNSNIKIHNCTYEEFKSNKKFDLIFSASAIHWVPRELAYERSHELLNRGGWLVAVWNMPRFSSEVYNIINDIILPLDQDAIIPSGTKEQFDYFDEGFLDFSNGRGFDKCQKGIIESNRIVSSIELADLIWSYVNINAIGKDRSEAVFDDLLTRLSNLGEMHAIHDYFPFAAGKAA